MSVTDTEDNEPTLSKPMSEEDEATHSEAVKRFQAAMERWDDDRADALDDLRFYSGDQWDGGIKADREASRRPCLTVNMLPQYVFQVTNEQRQNKPSIRVRPFDSKADVKTAEKLQGLIRHIEQNSAADVAYDSAFNDAVITGLGFFRIRTDYCNEESFDQDIFIERIENRFSVYTGPSKKPDYSDMRWCFVTEDMPREEFREQYPHAVAKDWNDTGTGDAEDPWWGEHTVKVAEYWKVTEEPADLLMLQYQGAPAPEGMPQPPPTLKLFKDDLPEGKIPEGYVLVKERKSARRKVKWLKMTGSEIVDQGDWAGRWIPIVPVLGLELHLEGITKYYGLVRNAKDPQRMYNYWWTAETEMIALAPKAPWIAAEGQISDSADPGAWERAHEENLPYLEYKPVTVNGQIAAPPQRQPFAGPPAGVVNARMSARDDMKSTTGIYDASLGNRGNETTGVAIARRQMQSSTATFHYVDNLARAIRHAGRIVLDLIRHVYDTERVGRILGEDGTEELVLFNHPTVDPETGEPVMYDLSVGEYDVVCDMGPAYATQREEAAAKMSDMVKANPKILDVGGDIILRNIDGPGMQDLADRIERTIPPEILGKTPGQDGDKPTVPVLAQQLAQSQAQVQQLTQAVDQLTAALNEEKDKTRIEQEKIAVEREKAYLDAETKVQVAEINSAPPPDLAAKVDHLMAQLDWVRMHVSELQLASMPGGDGAAAPPPASQPDPSQAPEAEGADEMPPEPAPPAGNEPPAAEGQEPEAPADEETA